jgi:hypothetical protein
MLDSFTLSLIFAGLSLAGAVWSWLGRYGLLVRVAALEAQLADQHLRMVSQVRRRAAQARWEQDDEPIQEKLAAIAATQGTDLHKPAQLREPWWRKHRGL